MGHTCIRISDDLEFKLESYAKMLDLTKSDLMRIFIKAGIDTIEEILFTHLMNIYGKNLLRELKKIIDEKLSSTENT